MKLQEYKVIDKRDNHSVFFFEHNGFKAIHHAKKYIENIGEANAIAYKLNRNLSGKKWVECKF